jgi:hypothetical protein
MDEQAQVLSKMEQQIDSLREVASDQVLTIKECIARMWSGKVQLSGWEGGGGRGGEAKRWTLQSVLTRFTDARSKRHLA